MTHNFDHERLPGAAHSGRRRWHHAALALLASALASAGLLANAATDTAVSPATRPQEPDEAQMRAAMQEYLQHRNVGNAADRPRYLNATSIYQFKKRDCRPAQADTAVICGYMLVTGTTYREARFSSHRFEYVDGRWVSRGPVRPIPAAKPGDPSGATPTVATPSSADPTR